MLVLNLDTKLK